MPSTIENLFYRHLQIYLVQKRSLIKHRDLNQIEMQSITVIFTCILNCVNSFYYENVPTYLIYHVKYNPTLPRNSCNFHLVASLTLTICVLIGKDFQKSTLPAFLYFLRVMAAHSRMCGAFHSYAPVSICFKMLENLCTSNWQRDTMS